MKTLRRMAIIIGVIWLLMASTISIYTHPAFLLLFLGCIGLIARKVMRIKPTKQYVRKEIYHA